MSEGEALRGTDPASRELIDRVERGNFRGCHPRKITFAYAGSEELRYLNTMSANANVGGPDLTHIILQPDARRIEVLEEFLHGTQYRARLFDRLTVFEAEVHVKRL